MVANRRSAALDDEDRRPFDTVAGEVPERLVRPDERIRRRHDPEGRGRGDPEELLAVGPRVRRHAAQVLLVEELGLVVNRRDLAEVRVSYFDSHEMQESTRILAGHSGFDVVDPSGPYFQRQIRSGAYLPLDKKKLPNLANQDPAIMARVAVYDPDNVHGVVYAWGTYGIIYNEKMVAAALPNVPVNSWRLIFDPVYAEKLAKCGISTVDSPAGVVRMVLKYLGKDPNTPTPRDLTDVESVLRKIRPYIRSIDSANIIDAMANGDSCIAHVPENILSPFAIASMMFAESMEPGADLALTPIRRQSDPRSRRVGTFLKYFRTIRTTPAGLSTVLIPHLASFWRVRRDRRSGASY